MNSHKSNRADSRQNPTCAPIQGSVNTPIIRVCGIGPASISRRRVTLILRGQHIARLVGIFRTVEEAEGALEGRVADVALVPLEQRELTLDIIRRLRFLLPKLRIVSFGGSADGALILPSLVAGALGHLFETSPPSQVIRCLI